MGQVGSLWMFCLFFACSLEHIDFLEHVFAICPLCSSVGPGPPRTGWIPPLVPLCIHACMTSALSTRRKSRGRRARAWRAYYLPRGVPHHFPSSGG